MTPSELKIASLSDIHLGHPNTSTKSIIANLKEAFPDNSETGQLDIIWIVGDLFDRALMLQDENVTEITKWMYRSLRLWKKYDITVRILEGTRSHDRAQSKMLETANIEGGFGVDLKYVDTLSIEYIRKHDIHVLYIPDEWAPETDDVWKQVCEQLTRHQLAQVDFTLLHGSMDYQLPDFVTSPKHNTERYLSVTKYGVFVGHHHKASKKEHLFAHGSFSRLAHGEEEAKGHWRCTFKNNGQHEYQFIENVNAAIYKTIDCDGLTLEQSIEKINNVVRTYDQAHIRISAERGNPILSGISNLRKLHPTIRWTTEYSDDHKRTVQSNLLVDLRMQYKPIQLTPDNLHPILMERIKIAGVDGEVLERCSKRLLEFL